MAQSITYTNKAFPDDQVFGLFGMFEVTNGKKYTLTEEDEARYEQMYGHKFADRDAFQKAQAAVETTTVAAVDNSDGGEK